MLTKVPFLTKPASPGWTLGNTELETWQRRRTRLAHGLPHLLPTPSSARAAGAANRCVGSPVHTPSNSHPWPPLRPNDKSKEKPVQAVE